MKIRNLEFQVLSKMHCCIKLHLFKTFFGLSSKTVLSEKHRSTIMVIINFIGFGDVRFLTSSNTFM